MATRVMVRTERLATIEQLLFHSAAGMRAVELADACGVDRRTVYRDLSLLNEIGVEVYQKDGRFFLNRERYLASIRLSFDELIALLLAASTALRMPASPSLLNATKKLTRSLPESIRDYADSLLDVAWRQAVDSHTIEIMDIVARAWGDSRKVRLWYESRDGEKLRLREINIYFLIPRQQGGLYIVGYDSLTRKVRALQLSRIRRAQALSATYEKPQNLELYLQMWMHSAKPTAKFSQNGKARTT